MIDWNKPIRTVEGYPAKLIATVNNAIYPRVVLITGTPEKAGCQYPIAYTEAGKFLLRSSGNCQDLVNADIRELFINIPADPERQHDTLIHPNLSRAKLIGDSDAAHFKLIFEIKNGKPVFVSAEEVS